MMKGWLTKICSTGLALSSIALAIFPEHKELIVALQGLFTAGAAYGIRRNMPEKSTS